MANITKKKPFLLHGLASAILPGLGQLFKGQFFKAIVIWAAVGLARWIFGWMPILWIIASILWLLNVLDAVFADPGE